MTVLPDVQNVYFFENTTPEALNYLIRDILIVD